MRIWAVMVLSTALAFGQNKPPAAVPASPVQTVQTKPEDTVKRCGDILDTAIHDKNPDVRKAAAEALSLMGFKDNVLETLAPMLDDHDFTVRIAVVTSLGDLKDRRTIPLLRKALHDPIAEVDFAAAKVLYQLRDPEGTQFLLDVVNGESKASSNYFNKEKRSALHMLHTPTEAFHLHRDPGRRDGPRAGTGIWHIFRGRHPDGPRYFRPGRLLAADGKLARSTPGRCRGVGTGRKGLVASRLGGPPDCHVSLSAYREKLVPLLDDKRGAVRLRAAAAYIRLGRVPTPLPKKPEVPNLLVKH